MLHDSKFLSGKQKFKNIYIYLFIICYIYCIQHILTVCAGMSGNNYLHFGTGTEKKHSWCFGREREIQETIPVALDGTEKPKLYSPYTGQK